MLAHLVSVATPSLNFALHSAMDASRGVGWPVVRGLRGSGGFVVGGHFG